MGTHKERGEKQRERIAGYITLYRAANHSQSPSLREMAEALGIGKTTVEHHLKEMLRAGTIFRGPGSHRSLIPKRTISGQNQQVVQNSH